MDLVVRSVLLLGLLLGGCRADGPHFPVYCGDNGYCHAPPLPYDCTADKECQTPWYPDSYCQTGGTCHLEPPPKCKTDADCQRPQVGDAAAAGVACSVCGHAYDAAQDGGGKAFADLPDSWTCPVCGAPKSAYKPQTLNDGTVVWVHHDDDGHAAAAAAPAPGVPTVTLRNGVAMPAVSAGTWEYNTTSAHASAAAALKLGYRGLDTANDYCGDGSTGDCKGASNQGGVGAAIAAAGLARGDVFVTTKVPGCGMQGISRNNCGADSVAAAEDDLKELGLAQVDLLLVHFPPPLGCGVLNCGTIKKQWAALAAWANTTKKTRALGVSNFCVSCFKCLAEDPSLPVPLVNQVQFHVGMGPDPEGLMSYCKAQNIVVEAYSPLGDGKSKELITGDLTTGIGKSHNKSSVQVALKWIWQHGHPLTTKSLNPAHLAQDADLFSWELTADEVAKLDASTTPSGTPSFMCTK